MSIFSRSSRCDTGLDVLRRTIAPQHTDVNQLVALGANDSSIRRFPFVKVRRALSADTTTVIPTTTSHDPAKIASTTMELIGHTIVTAPAITVSIPTRMYQPRAGNSGTSIANTVAVTPWNMNPTPIHVANSHTAAPLLKSRKAK